MSNLNDGLEITLKYRDGSVILLNKEKVTLEHLKCTDRQDLIYYITRKLWTELESELKCQKLQ